MEIRLVNLDRSPDRLATFADRNSHLAEYRRVSAVDGNLVDRDRLIRNQVITSDLAYTKGALGCALSHLSHWRDAIESDKALTIVEDDVVLAENFAEETERLIKSLPEDWEHVIWGWGFDALMTFDLLPGYSHCTSSFDQNSLRKRSQHFSTERIDSRLFRLRAGFGTLGYSISPRGARRLLDHCLPLRPMSIHYPGYDRPLPNTGIDNMMAQAYPHMATYVAIPPLVVTDNYHATSTVQTGTVQSSVDLAGISKAAFLAAGGQVTGGSAASSSVSPEKGTEFILVGAKRTILSINADQGCLQHTFLDKCPFNLSLVLADGLTQSGQAIGFQLLDAAIVLQPVGDAWVLARNSAFAVMRADGSVDWEHEFGPDSLLHLVSAESARLISPSTQPALGHSNSVRRRLLIVAPWLVVGGAEKVNLDVVTGLKGDFDITLVTTQGAGPWRSRFEAQVERLILLGHLLPPELHATALAFLIHRLAIDCVLISNSQSGYESVPFLREHFPGLPIFDLLHGQGGMLDGGGYPAFSMKFDRFFTGRVVITDYLRDMMVTKYGVEPGRLTRIYNGVDLEYFVPGAHRRSTPPVVSFIGRLAIEKHPEHILAIARELSDTSSCQFKIAGDGPLSGMLSEMLAARPLRNSVELLGHVDDVRVLLAQTDVLLVTSEMEGLPIVILEAMAMGVPIICSAVGGIPEMVRDGVDGILVPYGPNFAVDAAKRLEELLSDPERRRAMGQSARTRVETQFGMPMMSDCYRTLLREAPPPATESISHPIQRSFGGSFFVQKMKVRDALHRVPYLKSLVARRRVLHVGCTDYPVFDPHNNLHIQLSNDCEALDGLDTDREGIKLLSEYVPGQYFTRACDVVGRYDLMIVPETIEHVHNIREFLEELNTIDFAEVLITAPCLIGWNNNFSYADRAGGSSSLLTSPQDYIEEVHPDHKAWFTPYTLANCIEQFTPWSIKEVLFLDGKRMTAVRCSKTSASISDAQA